MTTNSPCEYRMRLMKNGVTIFSTSSTESVEVGRRHAHEEPEPSLQRSNTGNLRLVAAALELRGFPRQLLRIEAAEHDRVKIVNLHEQAFVKLSNGQPIGPRQETIVSFPITVILPEGLSLELSRIVASMARTMLTPQPEEPVDDFAFALNSLSMAPTGLTGEGISFGSSSGLSRNQSLTRMALEPTLFGQQQLGTVLEWLQQALAAMQRPAASAEFYSGIAKAVAQIIEVDRAEIILWDGRNWLRDENRSFVHPDVPDPLSLKQPSFSLLNEARATRRITIHPQSNLLGRREMADSIRQIHAAVACPILDIFDGGDDILGVLYADRQTGPSAYVHEVMETEQKLIMILATAIASSIAKTNREKLVTKYQQFFSPKVTEAIRQNPQLLEGEDADVTVMFCDIRGFSRETDRIGPAAAMKWVSETLSELSEHVLKTDGVLVDYVGDELFAMWGAPDRAEDHAQRAVQSAREMMKLRKELSERFRETLPNGVDFGIGVCTGPLGSATPLATKIQIRTARTNRESRKPLARTDQAMESQLRYRRCHRAVASKEYLATAIVYGPSCRNGRKHRTIRAHGRERCETSRAGRFIRTCLGALRVWNRTSTSRPCFWGARSAVPQRRPIAHHACPSRQ